MMQMGMEKQSKDGGGVVDRQGKKAGFSLQSRGDW